MNKDREIQNKSIDTLTHHIMAIFGGFMACYAVMLRSDFLGNAQTANLLYIVLALLGKNIYEVLIRVGGALVYVFSTIFFVYVRNKSKINVKYVSIIINSISILILSFIPENFNPIIALYPIFFSMAFQWNAFPGNEKYVSSTIFSTNNLRQASLAIGEYFVEHNKKSLDKLFFFLGTIICFHLGAAFSYFCVLKFSTQAIWFAFVPITLNLVVMLLNVNFLYENNVRYDGNYSKIHL